MTANDDGVCRPCTEARHGRCLGRTEPDCDLVGDHYQQTNACDCATCEDYEGTWSPIHHPSWPAMSEEQWPLHVAYCEGVR